MIALLAAQREMKTFAKHLKTIVNGYVFMLSDELLLLRAISRFGRSKSQCKWTNTWACRPKDKAEERDACQRSTRPGQSRSSRDDPGATIGTRRVDTNTAE
jgi:hypothetical protein